MDHCISVCLRDKNNSLKRNQKAKESQTSNKKRPSEELDEILRSPIDSKTWIRNIPRYKNKKKISKNTAYKRGRAFEYRVRNHFMKLGYYVVRKYASKGAEDLIAMKSIDSVIDFHSDTGIVLPLPKTTSEVLLIQCKNLKVEKKLDKKEALRLKALAKQCGATPLLASNRNHKLNIEEVW